MSECYLMRIMPEMPPNPPIHSSVCRSLDFGKESEDEASFLSQEFESLRKKDTARWNFDFYAGKPLQGQYVWRRDESDDEGDGTSSKTPKFTINESYATAYERWRRKEEYQKLKDKYGEDILSEDSVASADDDDDDDSDDESGSSEVDESIFDQKFLKVYGALKSRDPNIYDEKVRFFEEDDDGHATTIATDGGNDTGNGEDDEDDDGSKRKKKKKDKGMNLLEYHVNLVKKEKGMTEEDRLMETGQQPINPKHGPDRASYVQEMESIKKEFKNILADDDDDDDDDDDGGQLIKGVKKIPVQERKPDPSDILRNASKNDKRIGFLANYWDKKDLDDREKFLKEYILQKKYLDPSDREGGMPMTSRSSSKGKSTSTANEFASSSTFAETDANDSDDDGESDDKDQEGMLQVSSKLSKINEKATAHHYQESNAEVIKRYPREVESVRNLHASTTRNAKRSEIKERKAKEKAEALQRFRELRRAEVRAKLAKLKEISGNDRLLLEDKNIDIDAIVDDITNFDPEKYDECMSKLFDEQFYDVSSANPHQLRNLKKPKFDFIPGIDDVDDNLNPIGQGEGSSAEADAAEEEDIDADVYDEYDEYDDVDGPSTSKGKKNKKKAEKEPAEKKNIGIYHDLIAGEVPTRFRYRKVPPNDFGLSPEELLTANDKELNRWVSLKKTVQHRTMEEERYDLKVYGRKATDYGLKKKILKSVYNPEAADQDGDQQVNQSNEPDIQSGPSTSSGATSGKKSRKRRRNGGKGLESINLTEDRLRSYDLPFRAIKKLKGRLHQRKGNQSKRK